MTASKSATKRQSGFTLIELMIVVAIIGILSAAAIPIYQNYVTQAKVSAAISSMSGLQIAVANCIQENGGLLNACNSSTDSNLTSIPIFTATKEVSRVVVIEGNIVATFADGIGANIDARTFTLHPNVSQSAITWLVTTTVADDAAAITLLKNSAAN